VLVVRRTQEDRKADTRRRLLQSAAALFAERGVDAISVDAVAEDADRTSGAVYAHFGSKAGLVSALLDTWTVEAAASVAAEFEGSGDLDDHLAALWASYAEPAGDLGPSWALLEHELWLRAARDPSLVAPAAGRYSWSRRQLAAGVAGPRDGDGDAGVSAQGRATLVLALLLGLEMQRRLDPAAVPDELAVAGLRRVLGCNDPDSESETHAHAAL
jgi:AcrR family transcriptional regulator